MIIIIDNYDSFTFNLYQSIAQHTADVAVYRNDKISIDEIIAINPAGIILSPGPGRPETAGICIELIKKCASFIPILGVCLGHQAIVSAFGGQVVQAHEIVHGKSTNVSHDGDILFNQMSSPFKAARYHSLVAEKATLPNELTVIAENENGMMMAVRHKSYPCFGIQFHPESILTPEGDRFLNNFLTYCQLENRQEVAC